MPDRPPASGDADEIAVLFADLRNFTRLLEFYDAEDVHSLLDETMTGLRDAVTEHDGTIDKLIGDGLMALFTDESDVAPAVRAVQCAQTMLYDKIPEISERCAIEPDVGIGLASGSVHRIDLAGVDDTVVGRCVNVAARLQDLCKKFDVPVLLDRETRMRVDDGVVPCSFRLIPDQRLQGIYERVDTYQMCDHREFDAEYIAEFNEAARHYKNEEFTEALPFFIQAYSDPDVRRDRALLHYFASECFSRLNTDAEMLDAKGYAAHKDTQQEQAQRLITQLLGYAQRRDLNPQRILDIGCGDGSVTEELAEFYPDAEVIGIDSQRSMVERAREHHSEAGDIEYQTVGIQNYTPDLTFDILFSNSALHWVQDQADAYDNMREMLRTGGLLAIHQGHEGCYTELREDARTAYRQLGFEEKFEDFSYPLVYHTVSRMESLLESHDFEVLEIERIASDVPETIVDDFAEAGLAPYRHQLDDTEERAFVQRFRDIASERSIESINTDRLYVIATTAGST
ncbi:methyltransferase domain-containing protein [Haloplanus sp. C73]|uniref:methyltransferase domain-containing protein n=1 Tax=Haloplanus sp. C73 TaxID=3421641 RepID=UPI003EB7F185